MLAQRVFQLSLRRAAGAPAARFAAPAGILMQQSRPVATQHMPEAESRGILEKQRLQRPVSPHLAIYRPQITWYASALHRITGSVVSGAFYLFFAAYAVAPLAGWHLETQVLATAFASWGVASKVAVKSVFGAPFFFHCWNGLRHLAWDVTMGINNKAVIRSGWTVVGLSTITTLAFAFYGN